MIFKATSNVNLCCSNSSYLFIYIEQAASFLALSFDKLCKTNEKSVINSIQRLSVNAVPVGKFKKCLMNNAGTYILVVYDKCLSVVELPSKWGKYDQYNGGSLNTMCKSMKLSHPSNIMDAVWHLSRDYNHIVCLFKDNFVRIYNCESLKFPLKEYHLQSIFHEETKIESENRSLNIDMGMKFTYNNKPAYPIYVLKPTGQIECIIDYESSKNFEFLGEIQFSPSSEVLTDPHVISFMCTPSYPNCLVLLLKDLTIFHCIFIPKLKSFDENEENQSYEEIAVYNDGAILYIYETINLSDTNKIESIKFLSDPSNSSRYFMIHDSGVHSVSMPWLEKLQISYLNQNCLSSIEFDELQASDVKHIISTKPFDSKPSSSYVIGLAVLYDFGNTSSTLIALNNYGGFICSNIQIMSGLEEAKNKILCTENKNEYDGSSANEFASYIIDLMKRQVDLPILSGKNVENLNETETNLFMKQIINLIRHEYIEKQKLVILEFHNRSKVLKQQEKFQFEIVKEINTKNQNLMNKKVELRKKYDNYNLRQQSIKKSMENCFNRLLEKRPIPLNETEKEIRKDLKIIKNHIENYEFEIKENKQIMSKSENLSVKSESNIDASEIDNLRNLIRNENEKIKILVEKVEKLKVAVKI